MARYKTFANGGTFTYNDVNGISRDAERCLTMWRPFHRADTGMPSVVGLVLDDSIYMLGSTLTRCVKSGDTAASYGTLSDSVFSHDPSMRARGRRLRWRLKFRMVCSKQPAMLLTMGVYACTPNGGAANQNAMLLNATPVGRAIARIANPAALAFSQGVSGEFYAPPRGQYTLGLAGSGVFPTGCRVAMWAEIQERVSDG